MPDSRVDPAADRDAIRDLLARYTYNGDRGRVAELVACFAEDGLLEFPGARAQGPEAILAVLTSGTRNSELTFVRHHITNPLIEVAGDTGPDHSGTYDDKLVRTEAGWRFAQRRVRVDWQAAASLFRPMVTR